MENPKNRKKKYHRNIGLISSIVVFVLLVFAFVVMEMGISQLYHKNARESAEDDVVLAGVEVSAKITNVSLEQRISSQMIATDLFLVEWATNETEESKDDETEPTIYSYLDTYKNMLGFDTVFFVSAKTGNYYYQGGFNKTISKEDEFDSWYYNFVDLNQDYDIQIDCDETTDYTVSLFVNCRVEDSNGTLLGVAGTAQTIDEINDYISSLQEELDVSIYVINTGNAVNSFDGRDEYYKNAEDVSDLTGLSVDELTSINEDDGSYRWIDNMNCMTCQYNDEMGWNVVVIKDITETMQAYHNRLIFIGILMIVAIVMFVVGVSVMLVKINRLNREAENMDDLTGLYNNRLFREKYYQEKRRNHSREMSLFMVDIDDFKQFNDTRGHLYGNGVIKLVATELQHAFSDIGVIGRWGGDEFIGIAAVSQDECAAIFRDIQSAIKAKSNDTTISISVGIAKVLEFETLENTIKSADVGLYQSKENGKGQVNITNMEKTM